MIGLTHVLLTRFNVPTKGREADIRSRTGWLERRFDIFEQFCLPSVAAQTARDFRWIIYFDSATPELFKERIRFAQRIFPFVAHFRDDLPLHEVICDVRALLKPDSRLLLTTRLDNDDAIARNFVDRLQRATSFQSAGAALNFPDGFSWRDGWVYAARDDSNPFASALETVNDFQTIWARPHALLAEAFRVVQLGGGPAWLQVIHGDNVTNRIKGRRRPGSVLEDRFAIRPGADLKSPDGLDLALESAVRYPLRQLREAAVRMAKPFLKIIR